MDHGALDGMSFGPGLVVDFTSTAQSSPAIQLWPLDIEPQPLHCSLEIEVGSTE
jgi:hypothetical protein